MSFTDAFNAYLDLKTKHTDAILLVQVGDFYEAYNDDAETIARELEISVSIRRLPRLDLIPGLPAVSFPMAGVPFHAVDRYVAQLVQKGFKVAQYDHVEDHGLQPNRVALCVAACAGIPDDVLKRGVCPRVVLDVAENALCWHVMFRRLGAIPAIGMPDTASAKLDGMIAEITQCVNAGKPPGVAAESADEIADRVMAEALRECT